jgi:ABC-2 type transport system ATP-binding protein
MKRRLNLAAAVVHRPKLLFLDEPTTGVDPQSRNHIFEQVKALNAAGVTVVYTSHYMEEVQQLCRRIAILDGGKMLACDTLPHLLKLLDTTVRVSAAGAPAGFAGQLAAIPGVKAAEPVGDGFRMVVEAVPPVLAKVAAACAAAGAELTAVSTREPTLERVFLHLTGRELRD